MTKVVSCGGVVTYQLLCGRELADPAAAAGGDAEVRRFAARMANYVYLVVNTHDRTAVAVDAAWDVDGLYEFAEAIGVTVRGCIYTHFHFDHCGGEVHKMFSGGKDLFLPGAKEVLSRGGKVWAGARDLDEVVRQCRLPRGDSVAGLDDGDFVVVGDVALTAVHTPGHTPGSVCLFAAPQALSPRDPLPAPRRAVEHVDSPAGLLITGDTLFVGSCGRTDLPGSDERQMLASLSRLSTLAPEVVVLPGHNYASEPYTTVGRERASNQALRAGLRTCPSPAALPPCCAADAAQRGPGGWGPGRRVQLAGLSSDAGRELNGELGVVLRWAGERYEVQLLTGASKSFKPDNLCRPCGAGFGVTSPERRRSRDGGAA